MSDVAEHEELAPEALLRQFTAWNSSDIGIMFAESAGRFRDRLVEAVRNGEFGYAMTAQARISEFFGMEADLRHRRMLGWPTLCRLAEARLMAACLLAEADRDGALRMLRDQTRWAKQILALFPLAGADAFDEAAHFVFIAQLSYLVAHRYVRAEDRHIADHGIPEDFARTFHRVFRDEALQARVIELMDRLLAGN